MEQRLTRGVWEVNQCSSLVDLLASVSRRAHHCGGHAVHLLYVRCVRCAARARCTRVALHFNCAHAGEWEAPGFAEWPPATCVGRACQPARLRVAPPNATSAAFLGLDFLFGARAAWRSFFISRPCPSICIHRCWASEWLRFGGRGLSQALPPGTSGPASPAGDLTAIPSALLQERPPSHPRWPWPVQEFPVLSVGGPG